MPLPTFQEAIDQISSNKRVILGNGFSMAWNPDIFAYGSLYDRADFSRVSESARSAFDRLGTRDFEIVMRRLRDAATLIELYAPEHTDLITRLRADADGLRELLVQTIADNHPARPNEVSDEQYAACRQFLSHFDGVFTLNYDLLLYWTIMQDADGLPDAPKNDGFDYDPDDPDADWVMWDSQASSQRQKIYYIHGALHIYDADDAVHKYTWSRTLEPLIDQIRTALNDRKFPLFVAEDSAENKMAKIMHSGYLHKGIRSLESLQRQTTLVTLGFGFGDSDQHVVRAIARSKVETVWVGLFGDENSASYQSIKAATRHLQDERLRFNHRHPIVINFYDSATATVWG